ncbi:alpha/beta hydrolase [Hymenobacter sp. H14-R3]|uniref:alpha/beta fold hydrolase n=1 Tax=Hymenobacter sp. H14-R3 TaxID=3046308 RepID=UPI0024B8B714|nr:alpha/beta hydrolase [Hymenobacter sp. H14-R3]MDJ0366557.1 alpha/beta hydrolase [Hymenobacter sp. H14-R3]
MLHHQSVLAETLDLAYDAQGSGPTYLLLHGGAGPASMAGLAAALAQRGRVILPTHPGFEGQPRPGWLHSIPALATAYLALLEQLDLREVVVVGNSVGGWLAAELGLRASPRLAALVLLNAVGLDPTTASGPIADPMALPPAARAAAVFHDPARYAQAPATAEAAATMAANQAALRAYAGTPFMHDPALRTQLPELRLPTLVLWGASDCLVTPAYGRQFAELIPQVRFELVNAAGHMPQIEQLDDVLEQIRQFQESR